MTQISILIQRYFDATATAAEEARLREILADPATPPTPEVEEARAVMGFAAAERARLRHQRPRPRRHPLILRRIASTAAAAAAIAIILITILRPAPLPSSTYIYSAGEVNPSADDALAMMQSQLGAFGRATADNPAANILTILSESSSDE